MGVERRREGEKEVDLVTEGVGEANEGCEAGRGGGRVLTSGFVGGRVEAARGG